MRKILEDYLKNNFPNSDLTASFCEINTTVNVAIDLGLYPKIIFLEQSSVALDRAIKVFNKIFNELEPIWVLINEWNSYPTDFSIDQFENKTSENCVSWISYEESSEVDREQVFMIKQYEEINLINLFQAIINSETDMMPKLDCRIYFINPLNNLIFILWDGMISVESNDYNAIKPIYIEFEQFINQKIA